MTNPIIYSIVNSDRKQLHQPKVKQMELKKELLKGKKQSDQIIESLLPREINKEWVSQTFTGPLSDCNPKLVEEILTKHVWDLVDRGGKRIRPTFFLWVVKAIGGDIEKLKYFSPIFEFVHTGTLIIDDIQDKGEFRRGKPCLHKKIGVDNAINVGNFLYFWPLSILDKKRGEFEPQVLLDAYQICIQEMTNALLAQSIDTNQKSSNEKEYLELCTKTSFMLTMAAKMAVVLSGGSKDLLRVISKFTEAMGTAYQIQDDILGLTFTQKQGKQNKQQDDVFDHDIKEGKMSLIIIYTLEKATPEEQRRLIRILNKHTDDIEEIKEALQIIDKYESKERAEKKAEQLVSEAWSTLEGFLPESTAKDKLYALMKYITKRKT